MTVSTTPLFNAYQGGTFAFYTLMDYIKYAQLCCLAYLQNATHPGNDFKQQVKSLLLAYPNVDVAAMGFPAGWENEPLWK